MAHWKILLDQNIRYEVKELLSENNFDTLHTSDVQLQRSSDPEILNYAINEQRTLITLDKDFGSINIFPLPQNHYGVIRLKISPALPQQTFDLLKKFLIKHSQEDIFSALVILTETKVRISR